MSYASQPGHSEERASARAPRSAWARRAPLWFLFVFLVGPAPGEVGSCGQADVQLDAPQYCLDIQAYECARIDARGEYPTSLFADLAACRDAAIGTCEDRSWPPACQPYPTRTEGQACIDQLARASNVRLPITAIPECDLCP